MIRWHIRITLLAFVLFSAVVLLIHAQPDKYTKQQTFVLNGCSAACFVGIQPGVTSVENAVSLLQSSNWISQVDNRTINNVSGYISWKWSDQKPDWINDNIEGEIWATQKKVVQIMVYGSLQLGDIRLILGLPDQEIIERTADRKRMFSLYTAFYGQAGLMIQSWQPCNVMEPLRRPVILTYTVQSDPKIFPERNSLAELKHTCAFQ